MADLTKQNRSLLIKRYEHQITVATAQMQAKEIRILELEEEIERSKTDIEAQKKVKEEALFNIDLQKKEIEKEKAESQLKK